MADHDPIDNGHYAEDDDDEFDDDDDELDADGSRRHDAGHDGSSGSHLRAGDNPARKSWRACDLCRKRKQRCNGFEMPDQRCTVCINSNQTCTYVEDSKKRAPPKGYVESLEVRCKKAEDLLVKLVPGFDLLKSLGPPLAKETFARTNKKGPMPKSERLALEQRIKAEQAEADSPSAALTSPAFDAGPSTGLPRSSSLQSELSARTSLQPGSASTSAAALYPAPPPPAHLQHAQHAGFPPRPSHSPLEYPPPAGSHPHAPHHPSLPAPPYPPTAGHGQYAADYSARVGHAAAGRPPFAESAAGVQAGREREEEEANLIGFVQLAHRDEQLFKRFMGLSSGLPLMYSALGFKYGATPNKFHLELKAHRTTSRSRFWRIPPWESTPTCFSSAADAAAAPAVTQTPSGRPPCPQLAAMRDQNPFASWPANDLAWKLIGAYFDRVNAIVPLLHRPTFESRYNSQVYNTDPGFARTCLLVFAVASPYVDDERVLFPKEDGTTYGVDSSGWIYWHGFGRMVRHRLAPTELCDLQVAVLLVQFLRNSSQPGSCWIIVGEGLRFAQDVAIHRRRAKRSSDPVENEQFRRAFWCLYALEREWSGFLGRPFLLAEEDFDVELPYECDDEYWRTGSSSTDFVQPPDRQPSRLTAFILTLQLQKIMSTILKELYNTKRARSRSPAEIVEALEHQLQDWLNVLPPHLQWDPNQPEDIWFRQAVDLHLQYNTVLTYLHRPFLPSPRNPTASSPRSFNACIGAAHAIASILHCHWLRTRELYLHVFNTAYTAALVLLVGYWSTNGNDSQAALASLTKLEAAMGEGEKVFFGIGRARDAVTVLSAARLEPTNAAVNIKRKASDESLQQDAAGQPVWESRRPPPPSAQQLAQRRISSGSVPSAHAAGRFAPPPPPSGAYPPNGPLPPHPHQRSGSRNGEWGNPPGVSPRTPGGFTNSPSTSQGGASEGDSLNLGLFPDWDIGFSDPTMTLFPSGLGDNYWQGGGGAQQQQQPPPAGYTAGYPPPNHPMADPRYPPPPFDEATHHPQVPRAQEYPPPPPHPHHLHQPYAPHHRGENGGP